MARQLISTSLAVVAALDVAARAYPQDPPQLGDPEVRVVNDDETGETECEDPELNQGQCWEFAFKTLQEALDAATVNPNIEEIWVAVHDGAGYVPSEADSVLEPEPRRRTFLLANGLRIYGGFEGGETERDERDPEVNITVLNGQLESPLDCPMEDCFTIVAPPNTGTCGCAECVDLVDDDRPTCEADDWHEACALAAFETCSLYYNAFHVVTGHAITDSGRLDGFTITNGRCGATMKVVSFINPWQRDVIDKILEHCGLSSRAPPVESRALPRDAPPARELTYVSDLEHVQDPGPDEPIWSAD